MTLPRVLVLHATAAGHETLSYMSGWPQAFVKTHRFDATLINLLNDSLVEKFRRAWTFKVSRFDAVVLLHSVFSNSNFLRGQRFDWVRRMSCPKIYFVGNEYKLMPDKMKFAEDLGVNLLVTQSSHPSVHRLYADRLGCSVICIPSAVLEPDIFFPRNHWGSRPIDLGYRAGGTPLYLGHDERSEIAHLFTTDLGPARGLVMDISLEREKRFTPAAWADFLNRCKGQIGTEPGGDYFELTDNTRNRVNAYQQENPDSTIKEIVEKFFVNYKSAVPMRIIGGRHAEAAGTKTIQILFEGTYNGLFKPDIHYIALKKDFSNSDDVMRKFMDTAFCNSITDNAYDLAMQELTYEKALETLLGSLGDLL